MTYREKLYELEALVRNIKYELIEHSDGFTIKPLFEMTGRRFVGGVLLIVFGLFFTILTLFYSGTATDTIIGLFIGLIMMTAGFFRVMLLKHESLSVSKNYLVVTSWLKKKRTPIHSDLKIKVEKEDHTAMRGRSIEFREVTLVLKEGKEETYLISFNVRISKKHVVDQLGKKLKDLIKDHISNSN